MPDPSRVRVTEPFERYAAGFVAEPVEAGYRANAAAVQLRLFAHLSRWLEREGIDPADVRERLTEGFREEDLARVRSLRIGAGLVGGGPVDLNVARHGRAHRHVVAGVDLEHQ